MPREARGRRLSSETRAQMMLLTAVLLVIGFVALGALVARVNEAASATSRVQDAPLLLESGPMADAVDDLIIAMNDNHTDDVTSEPEGRFWTNLNASLDQLAAVEKGRGFTVRHALCHDPVLVTQGHVVVLAIGLDSAISFRSEETFLVVGLPANIDDCDTVQASL